jgi:type I restriction enzyme, S subunit
MKNGWQTKKLGEICEIERGGSPRPIQDFITTDTKGINWIKIGDATASGKYIHKTEEKIRPDGVKRSRMVYEGDFILSNSMSFGRPYIMKTTGCIHDGWLVLRQPTIDQDYLYYVLGSDLLFSQFDRLAAGSTVRNLNIGLAKTVEIPYPPLPEQRRIVGILDEAFEGIAIAETNTEKNLQNALAIFESYLNSVFTRRESGWESVQIDEVCESIMDCVNKTARKIDGPTPFKMIRTTNVRNGRIDLGSVNYVTEDVYRIWTRRQVPKRGDVILTREAPMGEVGMLLSDDNVFLGQRLVSYRANPTKLNNRFLLYALQSAHLQRQISGLASGSTVQHMRVPDSKKLKLPLPSLKEQKIAVGKLDTIREETERLAHLCQKKLDALKVLKKSLLHRAFAGQL